MKGLKDEELLLRKGAAMKCCKKRQCGFILIELLIVLVLLGVAIGVVYQFFFFGFQSYAHADTEADVQQQAQSALQQMDTEVRNGIIASSDGKAVLVSSDQRTLTIYSSVIGDSKPEKITYSLQNYPAGSATYRLLKCVQKATNGSYPYSYSGLPSLPGNDDPDKKSYGYNYWMTAVKRIDNDKIFTTQPDTIFKISDSKQYVMNDIMIQVDIKVNNSINALNQPVEFKSVLTVRGQGLKAS